MAVMEEGDGPNGFTLCTWPRDDTGKNAKFHYKNLAAPSSVDSEGVDVDVRSMEAEVAVSAPLPSFSLLSP